MSLMSSLYTGATGLAASSLDLSVIGDNIANGNTIGFKSSRAAFEDALAQTLAVPLKRSRGRMVQTPVNEPLTASSSARLGSSSERCDRAVARDVTQDFSGGHPREDSLRIGRELVPA